MRRVLPLLLLLLVFSSAAGAGEPRDILLLNSYHSLMRWGDEIIAGVSKEFPRETAAETLHVEYLDTKRLDPAEIFPAAAEYLGWKYSDRQPELIIAGDDNALDFLARYRSEVFPGIPVIFTGINRNRQSVDAFTDSWAAGTIEMPDFSGTIEMARSLVPDLAAIAVVTDATSTAYRNLRLLDALASSRFSAIRFEHFHDLPSEELARRLEAMPDSSAVLYISYIRNSAGELFSYNDGLSFVHQHTDAPVFVVWDFLLGEGTAVGGSVLRGKDVGAAAAQGARIYLETGELSRANEIPGPEPVLMLDYTLVRERGLYSRARELDPVWIGKPDTIWDRYRWPILITSVGFLGLISVLIVLGISKQKLSHNHELLAESEKRWKFALEGGRSGVWDWNVESGSLYVSDRWYSMLGYSAGTWIMRNEDVQDLIHPDDAAIIARVMEEITRAFSVTYEVRVRKRCANGEYRWMLDQGRVMEWLPDGRPLRVIGTQTDIHELIELHKGLEAGLHEKDVLIKEIHHRVKNNMQIIASMLSLEASQGRSRDYAALVEKTNRRIFAMAAVHEKLYAHDSTAFVPLQGYITELAQELVHLHRADVRIQVDCPDDQVSVDLDTAVPLGLIINELISNACEHAFPQDPAQKPHVLVTARSNTGELTVTVKDNGVGLSPETFSQQLTGHKSLGFVLVESLVHQLHGSLELETPADGGSRFILVIPV